jgi:RHH-type transcriptional regulator, proline utilization regulon repressor / proline dehydrogenase / delta 1-pyrroline-5-carboxylate dehydrogenase
MLTETSLTLHSEHLDRIARHLRMDESCCIDGFIGTIGFSDQDIFSIQRRARELILAIQQNRKGIGGMDAFMVEYDLSQEEGITLMCLAEALLRVPDKTTANKLIFDKLGSGDWGKHLGKSESLFVNAATWGLVITGRLFGKGQSSNLEKSLSSMCQRFGTPVLRKMVMHMMQQLGEQFVMGSDIKKSIKRAKKHEKRSYRYSYDMLGEAALTAEDAEKYFEDYQHAIKSLAGIETDDALYDRPGISIKLSALYPRYEWAKREEAVAALTKRLLHLTHMAREANITLTVDAEEADRLLMAMQIIANVFADRSLADWDGFGCAIQAYHKVSLDVIGFLVDLAKQHKKRFMIRLVKGAYWDTEIKDSQQRGLYDYPVFTSKTNTDIHYLACARSMIDNKDHLYSQFATHNAMSVMSIMHMMGSHKDFEFQCLHGMGQTLYDELMGKKHSQQAMHCRVYAPVGDHKDLLPYLVRRLLENGANSSFVNQIMDKNMPMEQITLDPLSHVLAKGNNKRHPHIPLPRLIYGADRLNAWGFDLSNPLVTADLGEQMQSFESKSWSTGPLPKVEGRSAELLYNPADRRKSIGSFVKANKDDALAAVRMLQDYYPTWSALPASDRAICLQKAADLLEERCAMFMHLAMIEAGKTWQDAVDEVREAVDFLRYYALEACRIMANKTMPSATGEQNILSMHGRGVVFCISPWNFPLAIFVGQVSAALVTGNTVVAKPANQTTIIAQEMVELLYEAGIPREALAMMPGDSSAIGETLVTHPGVQAVMLTGSNATAKTIASNIAKRGGGIIPLIAETGGQNAMIVDSTALPEQVVTDVVASAFQSAGQRCSALRVLFLQEDVADNILHMLKGAMAERSLGDPTLLSTDIGPVIDEVSRNRLLKHRAYLDEVGTKCFEVLLPAACEHGIFFAPVAYEIPSLDLLEEEVFGPVLHIIRYKATELDAVISTINATGFGLTLGIHSRIQTTIDHICASVNVGNIYVNRNIIGAVVGSQPFGGEGLSGTGPKAGGPHYLYRLCKERCISTNTTAVGGNASLMTLSE